MTLTNGDKKKVKKVVKGLKKASKSHARQANKLQTMVRTPRKKK